MTSISSSLLSVNQIGALADENAKGPITKQGTEMNHALGVVFCCVLSSLVVVYKPEF